MKKIAGALCLLACACAGSQAGYEKADIFSACQNNDFEELKQAIMAGDIVVDELDDRDGIIVDYKLGFGDEQVAPSLEFAKIINKMICLDSGTKELQEDDPDKGLFLKRMELKSPEKHAQLLALWNKKKKKNKVEGLCKCMKDLKLNRPKKKKNDLCRCLEKLTLHNKKIGKQHKMYMAKNN